MKATTFGNLKDVKVEFDKGSACCVIMASKGYPEKYEKGYEITFTDGVEKNVYVAGAKLENGKLLTNGGRVLGVTATGSDLGEAIKKAYGLVEKVNFGNQYYRKDIGAKALAKKGN